MKPILFNTKMVRAILDGRKTVTRRVVKPLVPKSCELLEMQEGYHSGEWHLYREDPVLDKIIGSPWGAQYLPPFRIGDVLYVRETFNYGYFESSDKELDNCAWFEPLPIGEDVLSQGGFVYKADFSETELYEYGTENCKGDLIPMPWKPSIHMPKEAARLFLRVTDVRAERLQDMNNDDALAEGCTGLPCKCEHAYIAGGTLCCTDCMNTGWEEPPLVEFMGIWNSTIKRSDLDRYGWDANPWSWVIEFEQIENQRGG